MNAQSTGQLNDFAAAVRGLAGAVEAMKPLTAEVGVPAADSREWYELLHRKLLPQLDIRPLLIVAVVGGTNIGKSVIFNHLAGETASAATPLAAGTRHPVCLVPPEASKDSDNLQGIDGPLLARLLAPFELRPWSEPADALSDAAEDIVFWRVGANVPARLVLMDTPDVDSDVTVNWQRAQSVRQAADVLIAVLTQQKYNDATVKEFFRLAVVADKPIVVVFNMVDLEGDRDYWPQWLDRFCKETGAKPELVYVAPYDRSKAAGLDLPFHRLSTEADIREAASAAPLEPLPATALRDELAAMHFETIKLRTYRGAVRRVIDPQQGIPEWLGEIRAASAQFAAAADVLSAQQMASVDWPSLPTSVLVEEIRNWWDGTRSTWSRQVHGFYRAVGRGVAWPVRKAIAAIGPASLGNAAGADDQSPLGAFRLRERAAVVSAVEKLLDELGRLAQVGNEILRPRLQKLIGGQARGELLEKIEAAHRQLPAVDEDYRAFLKTELDGWKAHNVRVVRYLETFDHAMALARPAITIGLFVSGWVVAGDLVGQAAAHAVGQTAGHLAAEAAIAGTIAGGGEAIVGSAGEGVRQAAARLFLRLQTRYAQQRAKWLYDCLERELLGDLLVDLRRGAELPQSTVMRQIEEAVSRLR
jgi:hypothetical protein